MTYNAPILSDEVSIDNTHTVDITFDQTAYDYEHFLFRNGGSKALKVTLIGGGVVKLGPGKYLALDQDVISRVVVEIYVPGETSSVFYCIQGTTKIV